MSAEAISKPELTTKGWLAAVRERLIYSMDPNNRLSIGDVYHWISMRELPMPPSRRAMSAVFRPGIFQKAGSMILDSNPYSSTRLINVYRVDHEEIARREIDVRSSKKVLRLFADVRSW